MGFKENMEKLKEGNKRFIEGRLKNKDFKSKRLELLEGQHPETIVLACSDSRVTPEYIFDANLGEIFVIETAGNIIDDIALGSIEYAVAHIKETNILMVLGHTHCGAVTATWNNAKEEGALKKIIDKIKPAVKDAKDLNDAIKRNVFLTIQEIREKSEIIKKAEEEGKIKIIPALYDMETGEVNLLE